MLTIPRQSDLGLIDKQHRFHRMRRIATGLLGVMGAVFVAATYFEPRFPPLAWLKAFAEAGLAGGLADWFAVTALFRRPLGLPLPHTALIPHNQERLGVELGEFVERNFLTPEHIVSRLRAVDLADHSFRWLGLPENAASVAAICRVLLSRVIDALDETEIDRALADLATEQLRRLDLTALSSQLLAFLAEDDRVQPVLDQFLDMMGRWLDANRAVVRQKFGSQSRLTPKWIDGYVVNRFVDAIIDLVDEVANAPDHAVRTSFAAGIAELSSRLRTDDSVRTKLDALKGHLVDSIKFETVVTGLWGHVKKRLFADDPALLERRIAEAMQKAAWQFRDDQPTKNRLNDAGIALIEAALGRFGHQISMLIADVVRRWDSDDIVQKIETGVGTDLQFIRLNGTLVGGAVGLALHAILVWVPAGSY